jgi:hypothetical protein
MGDESIKWVADAIYKVAEALDRHTEVQCRVAEALENIGSNMPE